MMRVLIDTHVLLWAWEDDPRLGRNGRKLLADPDQPVVVSIVSIWELAIKKSVGKLGLDIQLAALIDSLDAFGFELLPGTGAVPPRCTPRRSRSSSGTRSSPCPAAG